ncbi:LytTR family DNA-binding domain-containing protein [bacterium]|nr:LytTR family DNA-binding domain-containing protein [bacterium]
MKLEKSIKLVIAEDESRDLNTMLYILDQNFPDIEVVATTSDVKETIQAIKFHNPQLVLLDTRLVDGISFEVLNNISLSGIKIIFLCTYQEYAIEALQLSAIEYICKPLDVSGFVVAVDKTIQEVNDRKFENKVAAFFQNMEYSSYDKTLIIKGAESDCQTSINNLVWGESIMKGSRFHFHDRVPFVSCEPLRRYESILQHYQFYRCHPLHLINLNHISHIDDSSQEVQMTNGQLINTDNRRKEHLINKLRLVYNQF